MSTYSVRTESVQNVSVRTTESQYHYLQSDAEEERIHRSALNSREHKRLNSLKILRFDVTDKELEQQTKCYADDFIAALDLGGTIRRS